MNKHRIVIPLIILITVLISGCGIPQSPRSSGTLTVDRAWAENVGEYRFAYALVTWENTTTDTFYERVTIQAIAYDSRGQKLDKNQRSFFVHERGLIIPGFKGTLKIPFELGEGRFARMECSVIVAR